MRISSRSVRSVLRFAAAVLMLQQASAWAAKVPSRVTQPVSDARRVTLRGNVHPLARAENDRGLAPDTLQLNRMLLVLKRSPQQNSALGQLLLEEQDKSSPDYHHWLTPEEFGGEFGPSDSDIQAVTDWLSSEGFQVSGVTKGRIAIEFSGTSELMRKVFRAEIHEYAVRGKNYWANATNPQIPAALAPVVEGIASLNNFPRSPNYRKVGIFQRSKKTGKITPLYTINCPPGYICNSPNSYGLGPTDLATIYNILPLWNSSPAIDGTGESIAIVADSNINPQDVANFRSAFGLPANPVNVIVNGPDPGVIQGLEIEPDIDTEWTGAVAKGATIDLVVSEDTETTAGVDLSALYIVDNDIAPILSQSYGTCESFLGNAGNEFENSMWEQAAAEGITVVVATGDEGSAACEDPYVENAAQYGLAVSGITSSPFDVAVGGTDFNDPSPYFTSTSDPTTQASAKSYVPEITWNDSCARSGLTTGCSTVNSNGGDLAAGGGGPSNCAVQDASGNCLSGYPKPAWQTGTGVPADGARDIPDISLFAGIGSNNVFYIVCAADQTENITTDNLNASCTAPLSDFDFLGIGGTSVSAQVFAGIMALVDQKTGQRQGNANFVLYPLAAYAASKGDDCASGAGAVSNASCIFYDVTQGANASRTSITPGNNSVACVAGSPNCNAPAGYADGILVSPAGSSTPAWTTNTGYDLATGLGSVNVANLVNNWGNVNFHSSSVTLSLSPTTITHGQSVTANITVNSSSGTPKDGDVALIATPASGAGNPVSVGTFTLNGSNSVSGSTTFIPGGSWNVKAHYAGDGAFGSSDSIPSITVTVNPENSQPEISFVTFDPTTGAVSGTSPTPPSPYGSAEYNLRVDVLNSAGQPCAPTTTETTSLGSFPVQGAPTSGCPSGTVTLSDSNNNNNNDLGLSKGALNSQGFFEDQSIDAYGGLGGGTGVLAANYSGDGSFNASSQTLNYTIAKAPTTLAFIGVQAGSQVQYGSGTPSVRADSTSLGAYPGGTFTLFVDGAPYGSPVLPAFEDGGNPLASPPGYADAVSGSFSGPPLSVGTHTYSAQYSGDSNYQGSTAATISVTVTKFQPNVFVDVTPYSIDPGQQTTITAEVQGAGYGNPPTGTVTFQDDGSAVTGTPTYSTSGDQLIASLPYTPAINGVHYINASYSGDSNYTSAVAGAAGLTVGGAAFQITGGGSITISSPGQSGTGTVTVSQLAESTGSALLGCSVSAGPSAEPGDTPACLLSPDPVTVGSSPVSVKVTVSTVAPSLVPPANPPAGPGGWPVALWIAILGLAVVAALSSTSRSRRPPVRTPALQRMSLVAALLLFVALWASCGGGGGGGGGGSSPPPNPGTPAGTYTLTISGAISAGPTSQTTLTLTVQ